MSDIFVGKTILFVDDESDLCKRACSQFNQLGMKVLQAFNGKDAFDLVLSKHIDIVITDIRMPGGGGIELLYNIHSLGEIAPIVILISGFVDISEEEAFEKGAFAIIDKPLEFDIVVKYIEDALVAKKNTCPPRR